jgi:hypothetical protein
MVVFCKNTFGDFLESAWEVVENTSFVIEHYRAVTISLDYYGDSVINSLSDIIAAIVGFLIAYKVKIWQSVAIFFIVELVLLWFIRDNLTLHLHYVLVQVMHLY